MEGVVDRVASCLIRSIFGEEDGVVHRELIRSIFSEKVGVVDRDLIDWTDCRMERKLELLIAS